MGNSVLFKSSENLVRRKVRAKYIVAPDGELRLACVQAFNQPRFCPAGWEDCSADVADVVGDVVGSGEVAADEVEKSEVADEAAKRSNIERASRRAKINAFDAILCNPDLDTFATFTYRPDDDVNRSSYDDCYKVLGVWLSNRVQRNGLKYVIVPEHHKSGDIHFHGIMNSTALKLERALSPRSGRALTRNGMPIYNLTDWRAGFSTAQIIGSAEADRDKVAKYIFKYMGKQVGQRIGGRYALIGGDMQKPWYVYGDDVAEFIDGDAEGYHRKVEVTEGLTYDEYTFI